MIAETLSLLEGLEAQALQRRFLGMGNATLHFSLSIGNRRATRQSDSAIVPQHIAVQGFSVES